MTSHDTNLRWQWKPPRVAVVLYEKDDVYLHHQNQRQLWYFPYTTLTPEHATAVSAGTAFMKMQFGLEINPICILCVEASFPPDYDDRAQTTIYLLAEMSSGIIELKPGEKLTRYDAHDLLELSNKKQLASDVLNAWELAGAKIYEARTERRRKRK